MKKVKKWVKGIWFAFLGKRIIYTNDAPEFNTGNLNSVS